MIVKGNKVLVYGMQSSGVSAAYLAKKMGAEVTCIDDDEKVRIADFPFLRKDEVEGKIKNFDLVIVSPSISKYHKIFEICHSFGIKIVGELEFGCRYLNAKIVAVTGTNGKTTCTTMIEKLLTISGFRAKAMGNIGYPVSQVVLDETELDVAVIEVSSFQLETIDTFHPHVAVVLNLAPDHLDRYDDYKDYVSTKRRILQNLQTGDYYVFNSDDGAARSFVKGCPATCLPVSTRSDLSEVKIKGSFFTDGDRSVGHVKECKARGEHNRFNMLVAMNVGKLFGCKRENLTKLLKEYTFLPNRIEYVTTINGKNYYNDSKGTNVHACKNAIAAMDGTVGLIMGGSDKSEDFCEFFENLDEKVKYVAITGANGEKIHNSAQKMGFAQAFVFPDLSCCVEFLASKEVDNVLLSPCSASFDRYKNYAERGQKFKEIVYNVKF